MARAQANTLSLPREMRAELQKLADAEGVPLGSYIKRVLTFELARMRTVEAQRESRGRGRSDAA